MGRHALADLALLFPGDPEPLVPERLPPGQFALSQRAVESSAAPLDAGRIQPEELARWRRCYEPHAYGLALHFLAALPPWVPDERPSENWREMQERSDELFSVSDPFQK